LKVLLIFPRTPLSFFSHPKLVHGMGCKALLPPLGLITVAALLPQEWQLRLVDLNVGPLTEQQWGWADLVMLSGMVIQRQKLLVLIREAKARGKTVVVGGPYANSMPEEVLEAGADFLVLGEGENAIPLFLEALAQGQRGGVIKCDTRPDLATSPIPRFDLLNLQDYVNLSIQTSRGCPHDCEFCDVVQLYGRRPRYKEPRQVIAELEILFRLGLRGPVFVCDDNFIGSKTHARAILLELTRWSKSRGEPFVFLTQATVNLGQDLALIGQMTEANFVEVFLGIETLEDDALNISKKHHNRRFSMVESIEAIKANGLSIIGSFILGMDGEQPGAGERIISFIERTSIPLVMVNILQPAPNTRFWQRLQREGRLLAEKIQNAAELDTIGGLQSFLTSRPWEQIQDEYFHVWETIYEPKRYFERNYRFFMEMRPSRAALAKRRGETLLPAEVPPAKIPLRSKLRDCFMVLRLTWLQGIVSPIRAQYWRQLLSMIKENPSRLAGYLVGCLRGENMFYLNDLLRQRRLQEKRQK
jgi:radical SAM superfamily enzyme YgiQ (UPF0313 family)